MDERTSVEAWSDERRHEYLRSVVRRLNAIKLLHDATVRGTESDPYAVNDEIRRAVSECQAVMDSLEPN